MALASSPDTSREHASRPAGPWEIRLLGGLSARSGDVVLTRFPSRAIAALLARLALYPQRSHAREELVELLWPGAAPSVGRNRLRHALSTLRRLLEAPGAPSQAVIEADRDRVRLHPDAFSCDALRFERCMHEGRYDDARALYRGDLLPGFYDDWVQEERTRLTALYDELADAQEQSSSESSAFVGNDSATPPETPRRVPSYLTTFHGREGDRQRLIDEVAAHRLVTLTGLGGCGKTRLAVEAARAIDGFDGVTFVALADCGDATQAIDTVRATLGLPAGNGPAIDHVTRYLAGHKWLLVLDNFEQLVASPSIDLLTSLLARLPQLHLLLTSRRALQRDEEHEFVLSPLPLPGAHETLPDAARNPSVALFTTRARAVRSDYQIGPRNLAGILSLCRALEGLPLAIEIAASRVRAFSPQQMCDALRDGIAILARTGLPAAKEGRHVSLAAAIDWSWRLLDPAAQRMLSALTVFRGGWTAETARAVAAIPDARDQLEALVVHSLVRAEPDERGGLRFAMPDSVRQFVRERMAPVEAAELRTRHRHCMLDTVRQCIGAEQATFDAELPNVAEALETALADGQPAIGASLALALKPHWLSNGASPDALRLIGRTIDALAPVDPEGCSLLCMWARLLLQAGQAEQAQAAATRATEQAGDDAMQRAEALFTRTSVAWVWHRDGAAVIEPAREAVRLAEVCESLDLQARAVMLLAAITLWHLQQPAEADRLYEAAEAIFHQLGDPRGALSPLPGRVACLQAQGRHERAIELALFGERRARDQRHVETQLLLQNRLSLSYEATRRFDDALACCRLQAHLARRHHMTYQAALALWNACRPLARLRRPEASAQLMGFSEAYWVDRFGAIDADDRRHREGVRRLVTAQIGADRWRMLYAQGGALAVEQGFALL